MKLGEIFTCPSFEEVSLWGSILILSACAWWYWWEDWIWSEHKSHLSPGWVRHDAVLLLCSVVNTTLMEMKVGPKLLDQKPWGLSLSWFCSLSVWAPLWHICPRGKQCWSKRAQSGHPVMCQGADWDGPRIPVRALDCPWSGASVITSNGRPHSVQLLCWLWANSVPHSCTLSFVLAFFTLVWSYTGEQEGPEWVIHSICGGHGKLVRGLGSFNLIPPPFLQG